MGTRINCSRELTPSAQFTAEELANTAMVAAPGIQPAGTVLVTKADGTRMRVLVTTVQDEE